MKPREHLSVKEHIDTLTVYGKGRMSNEWKVADLELSQKLVELGVVMETEKFWVVDHYNRDEVELSRNMHGKPVKGCFQDDNWYLKIAAPDVAELGKVLPWSVMGQRCKLERRLDKWAISYQGVGLQGIGIQLFSTPWMETEAQARCAALIWLIESKTCVWDQEKQQLIAA